MAQSRQEASITRHNRACPCPCPCPCSVSYPPSIHPSSASPPLPSSITCTHFNIHCQFILFQVPVHPSIHPSIHPSLFVFIHLISFTSLLSSSSSSSSLPHLHSLIPHCLCPTSTCPAQRNRSDRNPAWCHLIISLSGDYHIYIALIYHIHYAQLVQPCRRHPRPSRSLLP